MNNHIEVIKAKETGLFTNYIFKAIPLAFDQSMSYYETLCGLLSYLKDTIISTVNNNADAVVELQNLYDELHDYVEHYFDNLDVQQEINNKLDEMAESGQLTDIIAQYLQLAGLMSFNTTADLVNAENLVNGSTAITLGDTSINDGNVNVYKITNQVESGKVQILLNSGLYATLITDGIIRNETDFINAINNENENSSYVIVGAITINSTINLTAIDQCKNKSFIGGKITLNDELFSGTGLQYFTIPNFTNCNFIGNGHSIVEDNSYVINGRFVNCNFINCRYINNATFVQSARFVNCYIENEVNNDFINTQRIYETRFVNCQMEQGNKAHLIVTSGTPANLISVDDVSFVNCIFEGQTNEVIVSNDVSRLDFVNLYTEGNSKSLIKIADSTRGSSGFIMMSFKNCRIQCNGKATYFINVENQSKFGGDYTSVSVIDCYIDACTLSNFYDFKHYYTNNIICFSQGTYKPAIENSKVYVKNSIADFSSAGHVVVKKFPALITFDNSTGGWHTNLYFVSLSHNAPIAICLSDPSVTLTKSYDSETGYVDVTMHEVRSDYTNCSASLLTGNLNNLNERDFWVSTAGYDV